MVLKSFKIWKSSSVRPALQDNDVLKTERFLHFSRTDDNVKTTPVHTDPWKQCCIMYARPVAGNVTLWRNTIQTHNRHVHYKTIFTNLAFLKPVFKCLHFQSPKTQLSCKSTAKQHKKFSIFSWFKIVLCTCLCEMQTFLLIWLKYKC